MVIIYHSADLDGMCSGAICKRKYPDAKLIGYNYGQPFPWEEIEEFEPVIMVDVSLPMEDMDKLSKLSRDLVWIDHHASAIKDYSNYLWAGEVFIHPVVQVGIAACEIAWNFLFPDEPMPLAVKLLGMYDTWRQNEPEHNWNEVILPFQYAGRLYVKDADSFPQYLLSDRPGVPANVQAWVEQGEAVLMYQKQQDIRAMYGAFECEFQGLRAICCNYQGSISTAFESVYDPQKHDIMIGFGYSRDKWEFGLRTTHEHINCGEIAKQFGGGGHAKAAGFVADLSVIGL